MHRLRHPVELGDLVVLAVERERARREETLDHRDRLCEPGDTHARAVEPDTGLLVVDRHPTCADAELHPTVGEEIERRELARYDDRVLVVVADDEAPDPQRVGNRGGMRQRDHRRKVVVDEVVGHEEGRVPERLGLARERGEVLARPTFAAGDAETKSAIVHRATLQEVASNPLLTRLIVTACRSIPNRRCPGPSRRANRPPPTRRPPPVG